MIRRVVGVDPSVAGRLGLALVEAGAPAWAASFGSMLEARAIFRRLLDGVVHAPGSPEAGAAILPAVQGSLPAGVAEAAAGGVRGMPPSPHETLVAIEEPLVITGQPRSPKTVVALLLRAGQFVELAEQAGAAWCLVKGPTWKAARGVPVGGGRRRVRSAEGKAASVRIAELELRARGWRGALDPDAADALNLALYATGAARGLAPLRISWPENA